MGIRTLLTGVGEIQVGGEKLSGKYYKREESLTQPHGFRVEHNGIPVHGFGSSKREAAQNAKDFLDRNGVVEASSLDF